MKELSIEQKAKRYDEAIRAAREWSETKNGYYTPKELCEEIFSELKESEDERIRKACIKYLNWEYQHCPFDEDRKKIEKCVAWLEKHGEQKSTDKVKPKFHEGDWVVISTTKGDKVVQIASVEYFKDGYPSYTTTDGRWFGNGTKARLLADKDVETITLPERKIIVSQKPAEWSEEDVAMLDSAIAFVEHSAFTTIGKSKNNVIVWLKSLKDRYTWKSNDEQINVSKGQVTNKSKGNEKKELLEQLKQLC